MKTLLEVLKLSTAFLQQRGIQQPRRQAEEIITDALGLDRLQLYLQHDRPLVEKELENCRSFLARRAQGEPAQYIRGKVEFLDCEIIVNPSVLIPRQETEILADKIVKEISQGDYSGKVLWDICCGSGCIGIAIKKKLPDLNVVLSDVSGSAIEVARENAQINQVEVSIRQGDLLTPFAAAKAHFVVCNPPYIAENEYSMLDSEVRNYEPRLALVGGLTGIEFYKRLARELPPHLEPHAKIWFEIGKGQGDAIKELFLNPPWNSCRVEQDWACIDRFFFLEIE